MKISYQREFKHNYLIIDPEKLAWQGYQSHMMAKNQIDGILRFQIRQIDDKVQFYYEITSRQPLSRILENRNIQAEEIRKLMVEIFGVLDKMETFLLPEGSILLEPEYLYINLDTFRVWFCVVPGLEKDFPTDFGRLLEYLLERVNHQDKESVVLAYGLYQETRKENYGMENVLKLLQKEKDGQLCLGDNKEDVQEEEKGQYTENRNKAETERQEAFINYEDSWGGMAKNETERKDKRRKGRKKQEKLDGSGWKILWKRWKEHFFGSNKRKKEDVPVRVPWEMMFQEESNTSESYESKKKQEVLTGSQRDILPSVDAGQGTVLLADFSAKSRERVLKALDMDGTDIPIPYYPFVIGKQENLVDFKLDRDPVSRLHMKISKEGEDYHIIDLNSTNGTLLNGRLLENNEEAELHPGDEICIARYRYRFE